MNGRRLKALLAATLLLPLTAGAWTEGPWHAARKNTYGWQFMTQDERVEHQRKMRRFASYQACKDYQNQRHNEMAQRARQAGVVLAQQAESGCDKLRARGGLQ